MSLIEAPAGDFELSPITGYTRSHWLSLADQQLLAVRAYASPSNALIALPGRPSNSGSASDSLEGYARTFLLVAFRVAGEDGRDPFGHLARYRQGLLAGTRFGGAESWPPIGDRSQSLVEAASIVIALHYTRRWLWDTLTEDEQSQVAIWLRRATGVATPQNNWVLFRVLVQEFLASAGQHFSADDIDAGLAALEGWYVGGGWYRDGAGARFDYYNGWALHLYPLVWADIAMQRVPDRARQLREVYRNRLREYLLDYVHFFGSNGSPVFHGRSLIYRFAAAAPLWLGEIHGVSAVDSGVVRRLASGTLRHFVDAGAFRTDGTLSLGWHRGFEGMTQPYSGPASPYWASKGFLGLLLPSTHPVWASQEGAAPSEAVDVARSIEAPGFRISSTRADGIVRLANHGSDDYPSAFRSADPHYVRFSYSSHTAPVFAGDYDDNHICLFDDDGVPSKRERIHRLDAPLPATHASSHQPSWGDAEPDNGWRIATAVASTGAFELRLHHIESAVDRSALVRETGFAVPPAGVLASHVVPMIGHQCAGRFTVAGTSPINDLVELPFATGSHTGRSSIFASLVILGGLDAHREAPDPSLLKPALIMTSSRITLTIQLPHGEPLSVALYRKKDDHDVA